MTVYPDYIARKMAIINEQLSILAPSGAYVVRIVQGTSPGDDVVGLLKTRLDLLTWAQTAAEADITAKITALEGQLSTEAVSHICGDVSTLSASERAIIAEIEDMETALGLHPSVLAPGATYYRSA